MLDTHLRECPWCQEADFDLVGLKGHLADCGAFDATKAPKRLFSPAPATSRDTGEEVCDEDEPCATCGHPLHMHLRFSGCQEDECGPRKTLCPCRAFVSSKPAPKAPVREDKSQDAAWLRQKMLERGAEIDRLQDALNEATLDGGCQDGHALVFYKGEDCPVCAKPKASEPSREGWSFDENYLGRAVVAVAKTNQIVFGVDASNKHLVQALEHLVNLHNAALASPQPITPSAPFGDSRD